MIKNFNFADILVYKHAEMVQIEDDRLEPNEPFQVIVGVEETANDDELLSMHTTLTIDIPRVCKSDDPREILDNIKYIKDRFKEAETKLKNYINSPEVSKYIAENIEEEESLTLEEPKESKEDEVFLENVPKGAIVDYNGTMYQVKASPEKGRILLYNKEESCYAPRQHKVKILPMEKKFKGTAEFINDLFPKVAVAIEGENLNNLYTFGTRMDEAITLLPYKRQGTPRLIGKGTNLIVRERI